MYDFGLSTLDQYGLTAQSSYRTRGALVCRTEKGLLIIREFHGSETKLQLQQQLLKILLTEGKKVDTFLENQTGTLVTCDKDNIPYTVQTWYEGRECDTKSREDILKGVETLALLHKSMKMPFQKFYAARSLEEEYIRHNQELRKIRKYIRKKGASEEFEKDYLANVQWFLEKGEKALEKLRQSDYPDLQKKVSEEGTVCHGEYNQHNVLLGRNFTAVTNFGHFVFDIQMADLYCFMRKILEKSSWNQALARKMLDSYHKIKPITPSDWKNLEIRFTYPEKYWKLANYYFSHNKAWISGKNTEKQKKIILQRDLWGGFPEKCFGKYPF